MPNYSGYVEHRPRTRTVYTIPVEVLRAHLMHYVADKHMQCGEVQVDRFLASSALRPSTTYWQSFDLLYGDFEMWSSVNPTGELMLRRILTHLMVAEIMEADATDVRSAITLVRTVLGQMLGVK